MIWGKCLFVDEISMQRPEGHWQYRLIVTSGGIFSYIGGWQTGLPCGVCLNWR